MIMTDREAPTLPPTIDDERAFAFATRVALHDRELEERGVPSGGLLRALALSYGLKDEAFTFPGI